MWSNNQENTTWVSRTDGQPICIDCIFYEPVYKRCSINKSGGSSSLYPNSCNFYKSKKVSEHFS